MKHIFPVKYTQGEKPRRHSAFPRTQNVGKETHSHPNNKKQPDKLQNYNLSRTYMNKKKEIT